MLHCGRSCALGWQPTVVAQVPEHLQVVSLEPGGGLDETRLWAETPLLSSPGRHPWELLQASPGSEPGSQQHVPLRNQSAGADSSERPRQREPPNSAGWHLGSCPRSLDA